MVLIISDSQDVTTDEILSWGLSKDHSILRMNFSDVTSLDFLKISNENTDLSLSNIYLDNISKVFIRRGGLNFTNKGFREFPDLYKYLKKEEDSLLKSLEIILANQGVLFGSYQSEVENYKINHLTIAKSVGLKIPSTLVTTSKKEVLKFYKSHSEIITKDIRYPIRVKMDGYTINSSGTFVVTDHIINDMHDTFSPSFFQERISKSYEIRIFFFDNLFYPMAILSQNDSSTSIDYRNYNRKKPNRNVPVLLPESIEEKVKAFISKSGLNTGSLDLIVDQSNKYYFLEVNPQGQIDWLSKNCNYYIEKNIAENLTQ